ncbi:hypothetical protein BVRB_1g021000 [Beta vulgaris subsp. vulgaris]|nr:hypothetical protein BVRB_1g021000 [Beta vulgaris subsp. vulgaris]
MVLCVTIQRRHLMVWGLFAPKYVFDVVGLILTDVLRRRLQAKLSFSKENGYLQNIFFGEQESAR